MYTITDIYRVLTTNTILCGIMLVLVTPVFIVCAFFKSLGNACLAFYDEVISSSTILIDAYRKQFTPVRAQPKGYTKEDWDIL